MKKFVSMMLAVVLLVALATPVFAADGGYAVVSSDSAKPGDMVYLTVTLKEVPDANSIGVKFNVPDSLEFVAEQSTWLITGELADVSSGKAAIALASSGNVNGDVLKLAFRVKSTVAETTVEKITCSVEVENNGTTVCQTEASGSVWGNVFTDVTNKGSYYYNPVWWAVENGVTGGTTKTTFSPTKTCTRAQVMTFLWVAAGRPEPKTTDNPFTDVKAGSYYYKAVLWAVENGITGGTTTTTFSPGNDCTRAHVVTFLWKAAGSPEPETSNNPFSDVQAGKYYYNAVLWAVENGITSGYADGTFGYGKTCTRAQVMTFLYGMIVREGIDINVG